MQTPRWVIVVRDCDAVLIPTAIPITVPAGSRVEITQALGGNYTVQVGGNLARISGKDADALGLEGVPIAANSVKHAINKTATKAVEKDIILKELKTCYDPEIPVNIFDLGLIYDCQITFDADNKTNLIVIVMTLTAPGCGMGPVIAQEVEDKILQLEDVTDVRVDLVFEPPWNQDLMSDAAKLELGLL